MKNKVTWFSIPSDNLEKTIAFYKEAFGWSIDPITREKNEDYSYHVAITTESDDDYISKQSGAINGCLVKRRIGLPSPTVLIEVDNLDEALVKIKQAGGKIVTEKVFMESLKGVFVFIQDVDGNYLEVFQNLNTEKAN